MNKYFLVLLVLVSSSAFADDPEAKTPAMTTTTQVEPKDFNVRESHWITSFGFEGMKYEVPFNFQGARANFKDTKTELWGGRLGIGGEIYLGAGFNTVSKIEGYYVGTLFSKVLNGGPDDENVDYAFTKKTGQVIGFDASQSIGFLFDMKTKNPFMDEWSYLTVEPFIEAGIGVAQAYNRINYSYDTGTAPTAAREAYQLRVKDELMNARLGAGVNFTSDFGYFLYVKATVNRFDITNRKSEGFSQPNGRPSTDINTTDKNAKIDPITTYAIGGGYKF